MAIDPEPPRVNSKEIMGYFGGSLSSLSLPYDSQTILDLNIWWSQSAAPRSRLTDFRGLLRQKEGWGKGNLESKCLPFKVCFLMVLVWQQSQGWNHPWRLPVFGLELPESVHGILLWSLAELCRPQNRTVSGKIYSSEGLRGQPLYGAELKIEAWSDHSWGY